MGKKTRSPKGKSKKYTRLYRWFHTYVHSTKLSAIFTKYSFQHKNQFYQISYAEKGCLGAHATLRTLSLSKRECEKFTRSQTRQCRTLHRCREERNPLNPL